MLLKREKRANGTRSPVEGIDWAANGSMKWNFHGRSYLRPKMKQGLEGHEGEERDSAKALR